MSDLQNNFTDIKTLENHIEGNKKGSILVSYQNCEDYEGMVLGIMIVFDIEENKYELDLQWASFGLDFYGDTLQESYVYQFKNLEELLDYLLLKYKIKITDIPIKYSFNPVLFPNPIKDKTRKPLFETIWEKFQEDFKNDLFLDDSLGLVYSSMNS